jgi:hypothetical protein
MSSSQELVRQAPKTGIWIIGYAVSTAVTFMAVSYNLVTSTATKQLFWIPMVLCVVMIIYTSWRRHRLLGTLSSASRTFWRRIVFAAVFAFAGFAVSAIIWQNFGFDRPGINLLGLLPYLGFAGMIWAVHQYLLDESDEYLRAQAIRQVLIASFVTLMLCALWGGLNYAQLLPAGSTGQAILLWFAAMGIGRTFIEMRL